MTDFQTTWAEGRQGRLAAGIGTPSRWWPILVSLILAVAVFRIGVTPVAAVASVLVVSWLSHQYRTHAFATLVVAVLAPQLVLMSGWFDSGWAISYGAFRLTDIILVGMWGAAGVFLISRKPESRSERLLVVASVAFMLWLVVAVVWNWPAYGLGTIRELGLRYLVFALPVYLAFGLRSKRTRDVAGRILVFLPLVGAAGLLPFVGTVRGWGLGEASRIFPSSVSLALLYAAIWLGLSSRDPSNRVRRGFVYAPVLFAAVVIVYDSHRSVWLAAAAILLLLLALGVIRVERIWSWGVVVTATAVVVALIVGVRGSGLIEYVTQRAAAFVDPGSDPNSYWRLVVWRAHLLSWLESPILGQGLGGHWEVYVPEMDARVVTSPHSVYVQTLVKLGIVGLTALLGWFISSWRLIVQHLPPAVRRTKDFDITAVMGLVAITGSITYGLVYALDFWSMAWIGLGLAAVVHREESSGME